MSIGSFQRTPMPTEYSRCVPAVERIAGVEEHGAAEITRKIALEFDAGHDLVFTAAAVIPAADASPPSSGDSPVDREAARCDRRPRRNALRGR
jgi:hypothetical protein